MISGALLLALLASTPGPQRIGILVLTPDRFEVPLSTIYGATRQTLEEHTTLDVADLDLFSETLRQETMRTCANDRACFLDKFRSTGAEIDLLLVVTVATIEDQWLLGARLLGIPNGDDLGRIGRELSRDESMDKGIASVLAEVVPKTIWDQLTSLEVTTDPAGAEVTMRAEKGPRTCLAPCLFERIVPGSHEISVSLAGYHPYQETVVTTAGVPAQARASLKTIEQDAWYESPLLWTAVAAGVVGASVGTVLLVSGGDDTDTVCFTGDSSQCP